MKVRLEIASTKALTRFVGKHCKTFNPWIFTYSGAECKATNDLTKKPDLIRTPNFAFCISLTVLKK